MAASTTTPPPPPSNRTPPSTCWTWGCPPSYGGGRHACPSVAHRHRSATGNGLCGLGTLTLLSVPALAQHVHHLRPAGIATAYHHCRRAEIISLRVTLLAHPAILRLSGGSTLFNTTSPTTGSYAMEYIPDLAQLAFSTPTVGPLLLLLLPCFNPIAPTAAASPVPYRPTFTTAVNLHGCCRSPIPTPPSPSLAHNPARAPHRTCSSSPSQHAGPSPPPA